MQVAIAFTVGFVGIAPLAARSPGDATRFTAPTASPLDDIVKVRTHRCDGDLIGTGTVLEDGSVLTAAHVVEAAVSIEIVSATPTVGRPASTTVTALEVSRAEDVARLSLERRVGGAGRSLASTDPVAGESDLTVVGHPAGADERVRLADLERYLPRRDLDDPASLARLNTEAFPGDSGGPVLDHSGAVAAMVVSREQLSGDALAGPASVLTAALAKADPVDLEVC